MRLALTSSPLQRRPRHLLPPRVAGTWLLLAAVAAAPGAVLSAQPPPPPPPGAQLPYDKFGHQPNDEGRCAATSMVNSFWYLANIAPSLYGNTDLLTGPGTDHDGDGDVDLKDAAHSLDDLMGGGGCGVNRQQAWEGKLSWFDQYAPGTTVFHGMVDEDFSTWDGSQFLTRGVPTSDFLIRMIEAEEDVELRIGFAGGDGHYITMTSFHITPGATGNFDNVFEPNLGETASLDYIDPNCPIGTDEDNPGPSLVPLRLVNGVLTFDWVNGNGTTCDPNAAGEPASITAAWAESPVPEPSAVVLLATGVAVLAVAGRRLAGGRS